MKKCPNCEVYVNTDRVTCPLCRHNLVEEVDSPFEVVYQQYPKFQAREKRMNFIFKFALFVTIVTCIVAIVTNYLTYEENNRDLWSLIVIASFGVAWTFIKGIIISKGNLGRRLLVFGVSIIILLMCIERKFDNTSWALNYMLPFIIAGDTMTLTMAVFIKHKFYKNWMGYLFFLSIFCVLPIILYKVKVISIDWPSVACALYGLATFLGMIIFGGHRTFEEFKKWFHM